MSAEECKVGETSAMESVQPVVLNKAIVLGSKVRRRVYARVAGQMTNVQMRTKESIDKLNFTVDLVR